MDGINEDEDEIISEDDQEYFDSITGKLVSRKKL